MPNLSAYETRTQVLHSTPVNVEPPPWLQRRWSYERSAVYRERDAWTPFPSRVGRKHGSSGLPTPAAPGSEGNRTVSDSRGSQVPGKNQIIGNRWTASRVRGTRCSPNEWSRIKASGVVFFCPSNSSRPHKSPPSQWTALRCHPSISSSNFRWTRGTILRHPPSAPPTICH